jgi:hypothetical protein
MPHGAAAEKVTRELGRAVTGTVGGQALWATLQDSVPSGMPARHPPPTG